MRGILKLAYQKIYGVLGNRGLNRFWPVAMINGIVMSKINAKEESVKVDGNIIFVHEKNSAISSALLLLEKVEPTTTRVFSNILKEGDGVIDLGANIGYYTLLSAKKVGKTGKVYAFEPDPENIRLLKKNIQFNGYKNVIVAEKAVAEKRGKIRLYLGATSDTNSIYQFSHELRHIDIDATSLDEYFFENKEKFDLIKMDMEGAEYSAMLGMKSLLERNSKIKIIAEFAPALMRKCGFEPRKYLELIEKNGFEIYNINEKKRGLEKTSIEELMRSYTKEDEATNLLCVRGEAAGILKEAKTSSLLIR